MPADRRAEIERVEHVEDAEREDRERHHDQEEDPGGEELPEHELVVADGSVQRSSIVPSLRSSAKSRIVTSGMTSRVTRRKSRKTKRHSPVVSICAPKVTKKATSRVEEVAAQDEVDGEQHVGDRRGEVRCRARAARLP